MAKADPPFSDLLSGQSRWLTLGDCSCTLKLEAASGFEPLCKALQASA